jgi:hypothetical protein
VRNLVITAGEQRYCDGSSEGLLLVGFSPEVPPVSVIAVGKLWIWWASQRRWGPGGLLTVQIWWWASGWSQLSPWLLKSWFPNNMCSHWRRFLSEEANPRSIGGVLANCDFVIMKWVQSSDRLGGPEEERRRDITMIHANTRSMKLSLSWVVGCLKWITPFSLCSDLWRRWGLRLQYTRRCRHSIQWTPYNQIGKSGEHQHHGNVTLAPKHMQLPWKMVNFSNSQTPVCFDLDEQCDAFMENFIDGSRHGHNRSRPPNTKFLGFHGEALKWWECVREKYFVR